MNPISNTLIVPDDENTPEVSWAFGFTGLGRQYQNAGSAPVEEAVDEFGDVAKLVDKVSLMLAGAKAAQLGETVAAAAAAYLPTCHVGESTARCYRGFVATSLGCLADLPVLSVTREDVQQWVAELFAKGNSHKTIQNKVVFLHQMFEGFAGDLPRGNPFDHPSIPATPVEPMYFLTPSELPRFMAYIQPFWHPLAETLFATGLRWGEATALRVRDVDLAGGRLNVVRAWKLDEIGAPKTAKGARTIGIAPKTVETLARLMFRRSGDDLVFTNTQGNRVKHATFHNGIWVPARDLVNGREVKTRGGRVRVPRFHDGTPMQPAVNPLNKELRIHDARHTCASWLLAQGVPMIAVQHHLGHASIRTTVDRYGHLLPSSIAAVTSAIAMALDDIE